MEGGEVEVEVSWGLIKTAAGLLGTQSSSQLPAVGLRYFKIY